MRSPSRLLSAIGLVLLFTHIAPHLAVNAQDRGAPRFGLEGPTDSVEAQPADAGRLWSLVAPPLDRFRDEYGIDADTAWVAHLRRSVLRLPGCTAALVSSQGLALTTARCVRQHLDEGSTDRARVAEASAEESSVFGLYADRLVEARDVTDRVREIEGDTAAVARVEEQMQRQADAGHRVQVMDGSGGARQVAYTYHRYDDVRIAFLPAQSVSGFGGIETALTYPRHDVDAALIRVYGADGAPLTPNHYFESSTQGARPGDAIVSVGHPTETQRVQSADQIAFLRDVRLPVQKRQLETWIGAAEGSVDGAAASATDVTSELWTAKRTLKQIEARLEALRNEDFMRRLRERDDQLREAVQQDPSLSNRFGGVLDSLAAIQNAKRTLQEAYRAFGTIGRPYASATLRRALLARRAASAEGPRRDSLLQELAAVPSQPADIDVALLADRLQVLQTQFASDSAWVERVLKGRSPRDRAATIVEESEFANGAGSVSEADLPASDPALELASAVGDRYDSFRAEWERLSQRERALTERLARARDRTAETPVSPASQRTPRLTDGRVAGYPYNGTLAPPFTTFYGLYGQHRAFDGTGAWSLPEEWLDPPGAFDRSVPLNLIASTDPVAASDGAPLLNESLQIVGVTGTSNIEGVAGRYMFLPEHMRSVGVDIRGLRQSLSAVYEAESLVDELFGPSPDAADTAR